MLIAAEVFVLAMLLPVALEQLRTTPALFWLHSLPSTVAIFGAYMFLFIARGRRTVIAATVLQIVLFGLLYSSEGLTSGAIERAYGY
ncbi:hypothetical protein [Sphingomonas xanthus]|uniref:Uncharacterized protein n=1 Tax=Sphingomonas xanthus TaxID=2594473 RepID=A0A516ITI4_9SPHN|nr:hypothetical protein [Sphingomonas xanthus]QDP20218.1 hypothetical protein FMM02_09795 [Sphingomonas xanthus]